MSLHAGQPLALAVRERIAALAAPGYSVVIPTCNRLDILQRCLHCLERQTLPRDRFEVIVVDDASTDGTADFLAGYHPPFTLRTIVMPRRGGPGKARNAGIRAARGDIVHFLNDDALIEPNVLALHATLHEALADTPVSVLGRFDFAPPFTDTLWGYTLQHGDLLFRYPTFTHNGLHGHTSYYTCNISTPRQQLVQAGLFDEAFTGGQWGAEDMEFGMRLAALPVPVLFRDDSRSVHVHDVGVEGLARTALVRGGGAVWLFAKHGGAPH
ncbi:glycosyltransferase family 2 protein, partial [Nitratidesulfovibrio oxamicus]|uniref:glycosyltransferase family 2 protein n=1 Tax=Nitratidesulfovibrio oxamicus TaxID=32016 RepID=UPI0018C4FD44